MAETTKRSTNNSASKSRKSRTDIIRTTLGMYLKQKNYTVSGGVVASPIQWIERTTKCERVTDKFDEPTLGDWGAIDCAACASDIVRLLVGPTTLVNPFSIDK